jgi:hypothetical protein
MLKKAFSEKKRSTTQQENNTRPVSFGRDFQQRCSTLLTQKEHRKPFGKYTSIIL